MKKIVLHTLGWLACSVVCWAYGILTLNLHLRQVWEPRKPILDSLWTIHTYMPGITSKWMQHLTNQHNMAGIRDWNLWLYVWTLAYGAILYALVSLVAQKLHTKQQASNQFQEGTCRPCGSSIPSE